MNTAAFHHVEQCEHTPSKGICDQCVRRANVAKASASLDAVVIHISTDYVFDGAKNAPYVESDLPRPLNAYGNSKLAGEYFVRGECHRHFVLRTSALYGKHPCRAKGGD